MGNLRTDFQAFIDANLLKKKDIAEYLGVSNAFITQLSRGDRDIPKEKMALIKANNLGWDISMFDESTEENRTSPQFEILDEPNGKKGLIPFYGNIQSTGGDVSLRADVDCGQIYPTAWIDAGDFFRDATAIIEHVGESMVEYPNRCMIAIKRVLDMSLLVSGDDYVIETSEYRVTKKVLDGDDYITGYSTNQATYPDGQLVYAPMKIPKDKIRAIYTIIGYTYMKNGQKIVLRTKK